MMGQVKIHIRPILGVITIILKYNLVKFKLETKFIGMRRKLKICSSQIKHQILRVKLENNSKRDIKVWVKKVAIWHKLHLTEA